jgi:hypothetical protein
VPPLAWDDENIDDPAAVPATTTRPTLLQAWVRNYDVLAKQGLTRQEIARKLGLGRRELNQRLRDCRLNGLIEGEASPQVRGAA